MMDDRPIDQSARLSLERYVPALPLLTPIDRFTQQTRPAARLALFDAS